jgi:hypothetical protein
MHSMCVNNLEQYILVLVDLVVYNRFNQIISFEPCIETIISKTNNQTNNIQC